MRTRTTDLNQSGAVTALGVDQNERFVGRHATQRCRANERTTVRNRLASQRVRRNQCLDDIVGIRERYIRDFIIAEHIDRNGRIHNRPRFTAHAGDDDLFLNRCLICHRLVIGLCIGYPPGNHHTYDH